MINICYMINYNRTNLNFIPLVLVLQLLSLLAPKEAFRHLFLIASCPH